MVVDRFQDAVRYAENVRIEGYSGNYRRVVNAFGEARDELAESRQQEFVEQCQWEIDAFNYTYNIKIVGAQYLSIDPEKRPFTPFKPFSQEALEYYRKRLQSAQHPILRSRYADILWTYSEFDNNTKVDFAKEAIKSYVDLGRLARDGEESQRFSIECFERAASLALTIGDSDSLTQLVQDLTDVIKNFESKNEYRWTFEPCEILLRIRKHRKLGSVVSGDTLSFLKAVLLNAREKLRKDKLFFAERRFLGLLVQLEKELGSEEAGLSFERYLAQSFEAEAETRGENLVKATFYESALRAYLNLKVREEADNTRIKELKRKVRENYKSAQKKGEFKRISARIEIPEEEKKQIVKLHEHILTQPSLEESLRLLAEFTPDVKKAREFVEVELKKYASTYFFSQVTVQHDRKVAEAYDDEAKIGAALDRRLLLSIHINMSLVMEPIIDRLIEKKGLCLETLIKYFDDWGLMDPQNQGIVEVGFERYFAGDYVSAIHILVPQFESTLRRLLFTAGKDVTAYSQGQFEERTFGNFLSQPEVTAVLGKNLRYYIDLVMVKQTGLNLRNYVAHGLLSRPACTREIANLVFHLYLTLSRFSLDEKGGTGQ